MLRGMIKTVEGGKEIYGGCWEVHYEVGYGLRDGESFGWCRWLGWRGAAGGSFGRDGYSILLCGG